MELTNIALQENASKELTEAFCFLDFKSLKHGQFDYIKALNEKERRMNKSGIVCRECGQPVSIQMNMKGTMFARHAFMHYFVDDNQPEFFDGFKKDYMHVCPYASDDIPSKKKQYLYSGEHNAHKHACNKIAQLIKNDVYVKNAEVVVNKRFNDFDSKSFRVPDVLVTIGQQKIAIEIQNSWLDAGTILDREQFYFKNKIGLIWVFIGKPNDIRYSNKEKLSSTKNHVTFGSYMGAFGVQPTLFYFDDEKYNYFCLNAVSYSADIRKAELTRYCTFHNVHLKDLVFDFKKSPFPLVDNVKLICKEIIRRKCATQDQLMVVEQIKNGLRNYENMIKINHEKFFDDGNDLAVELVHRIKNSWENYKNK